MASKRVEKAKRFDEKAKNTSKPYRSWILLLLLITIVIAFVAVITSPPEIVLPGTLYTPSPTPTRIPRYTGNVSDGYTETNSSIVGGSVSSGSNTLNMQTPSGIPSSDHISTSASE